LPVRILEGDGVQDGFIRRWHLIGAEIFFSQQAIDWASTYTGKKTLPWDHPNGPLPRP